MTLEASCPRCAVRYDLDDRLEGKTIRCKHCNHAFVIHAGAKRRKSRDRGPVLVPSRGATERADKLPGRGARRSLVIALCAAGGLLPILGFVWMLVLLFSPGVGQELKDLQTGDSGTRRQAVVWLLQAAPQDADRARVTAALEPLLFNDLDHALKPDLVLRTYLHWAGKDNVPALVRLAANPTHPAWDSTMAGLVLDALGQLKDERAIEVVAEHLGDPVLHDRAVNALKIMGPMAEPVVLDCLFAADPDTRARAGQLLEDYGVKPGAIAAEALARLQSNQANIRAAALNWCVDNPPSDAGSKAAGAKILAHLLDDLSPKVNGLALRALKTWATTDCLPQLRDYARRQQKAAVVSPALIDVLAQVPDASAAETIAMELPNPALRARAIQGLLKLGAVADKAVLPYLDYPDPAVAQEARDLCRLLKIPAERQLEQTLADVADSDALRSQAALRSLAQLRPDEASRAKVAGALNAALLDPNEGIRDLALNAVKVWGMSENTAALLRIFTEFQTQGRPCNALLIEALGAIRDPRAAVQLAQGLTHPGERGAASKALLAIGSPAEAAVIPFIQSADQGARITACRILGEIGTDKSVQPLSTAAQMYYLDSAFNQEAAIASQKIMARM